MGSVMAGMTTPKKRLVRLRRLWAVESGNITHLLGEEADAGLGGGGDVRLVPHHLGNGHDRNPGVFGDVFQSNHDAETIHTVSERRPAFTANQKLVPLQWSFCRSVSKNELPAKCMRRTESRLRRMVTTSPAVKSLTPQPSALRMVSGLGLTTLTRIVDCRLTIRERLESVCGQIGVSAKTSALGMNHGAARGQRVSGRAGRRTDDQAVATITGKQLIIDADFQSDESGNNAATDDKIVEARSCGW